MKQKNLLFLFAAFLFCASAHTQTMAPDSSFGVNGLSTLIINNDDAVTTSIVEQGKKILISGYSYSAYPGTCGVLRVTGRGNRDKTFADNGVLYTARQRAGTIIRIIRQQDGKLLTFSREPSRNEPIRDTLWVERFLPEGKPDLSFGIQGGACFTKNNSISINEAIALKPNGKIVVLYTAAGIQYTSQLNPDGAIDKNYGTNGRVTSQSAYDGILKDIIALPNNKILAAGFYRKEDNTYGSCIIRYNPEGKIDSTFGVNGVLVNNNTISNAATIIHLKLQADNKVLLYTQDNGNDVLFRYNTDATPDGTFGTGGRVITGVTNSNGYAAPYLLEDVQANSRIVANLSSSSTLVRYMPNGTLDNTFGVNGYLDISKVGFPNEYGTFACIGNKLVVTGFDNYHSYLKVAKYIPAPGESLNNQPLLAQKIAAPAKDPSIRLYPNPVTDVLNINNLRSNALHTLTLTNVAGQVVKSVSTQNATYQWNVKGLPAGIYYVHVVQNKGLPVTFKIEKQ